MNVIHPILQQSFATPDEPAMILGNATITYQQVRGLTATAAARLHKLGVKRGDRVALLTRNPVQIVLASLACAWLGAAAVPLMNVAGAHQVEALARPLELSAVICEPQGVPQGAPTIERLERRIDLDTLFRHEAGMAPAPLFLDVDDELWRIGFSSGTTGTAKALGWSHRVGLINSAQLQTLFSSGTGERLLLGLGAAAMFATAFWTRMLQCGGCVIFPISETAALLPEIERTQPTQVLASTHAATTLAEQVSQKQPGSVPVGSPGLHTIIIGGSMLSAKTRATLESRVAPKVLDAYGCSEAGMIVTGDGKLQASHPGLLGRVAPLVRVEAVDDRDRPLPPGTPGRLRFMTYTMASGYIGDDGSSSSYFKDGWFYSGDLGLVTAEGYLGLQGRVGAVINVGGVKIDPQVIESILSEDPRVVDVAVTAATDSEGQARSIVAMLVLRDRKLLQQVGAELENAVRSRLGVSYTPAAFVAVDQLPRNPNGKLLREELRVQIKSSPK